MRRNRCIMLIVLVVLLAGVSSCKKSFLESAPYAVVSDADFYKTTDECQGAVFQAYNRTVHLAPIYLFIWHALNDYAGDDLLRTNHDDFTVWNNFSPDNVQFTWGWKYCFQGIYLCNYTLDKLATAPIPQADKDKLGAECKAIRGFMFYTIATRFGTAPIITTTLPVAQYYTVKFSNAVDIYNQAIKDFTEAEPFLPPTWDAANKGRFSQVALKMMLAKTYMQLAGYPINKTENWQKAVDELAAFVPKDKRTAFGVDLLPDYGTIYNKAYDQSVESVFEVNEMYYPPGANVSLETGSPGSFLENFEQPNIYEGGGQECFTADLYDEYERDNSGNIIDKRYTYTMLEPGDVFYITKGGDTILHSSTGRPIIKNVKVDKATNTLTYQIKDNSDQSNVGWVWPGHNNQWYPNYKYLRNAKERTDLEAGTGANSAEDLNNKYLRFGDAVLMYAEALNETGNTAEAATYVNEIRTRVNNTASIDPRRIYQKTIVKGNLPMVSGSLSQATMRVAIQHESRMELAGENWRYENLRRWGIADLRLHQMAAKSPVVGQQSNAASKYVKGAWDYYPVPSSEYKP
jgi:hypothetical protein